MGSGVDVGGRGEGLEKEDDSKQKHPEEKG